MSYAHDDIDYTTRLADHLRSAGLPVWFDHDLAWGARFPAEIPQRIRDALAVIVIMSPAAEASEWVEREILEAQLHDRQLLPVLVSGERFFLLASSSYFDARGGALPGERELSQLRALRDEARTGTTYPPEIRLTPPVGASTITRPSTGVSFAKLRSYLGAGELTSADILTSAMLLQSVGRHGQGWLRLEDGARVPSDLLTGIDAAWAGCTRGAHGFRAQLACRRMVPSGTGREIGAPDLHGRDLSVRDDFASLAAALRWNAGGNRLVLPYGAFVQGDRTAGFFPTLRNPQSERHHTWHDRWVRTVMSVHIRISSWDGGQP